MNTKEGELHCCHDGKGGRTVVAWSLEHMRADSKMAAGLMRVRIGAQEVQEGPKMSYARAEDVGENIVLTVVADMNFVVTGMALD